MHFTGFISISVSFLYPAILAKTDFATLKIGKCQTGRKDIIRLTDTVHQCFDRCRNRPVCKAYSFHRLTRMCRLHTEQGTLKTCTKHFYSERTNWDMTNLNGCTCTETETCIPEGIDDRTFTCKIKECIMPNDPTNGKVLGNAVSVGRRIRYICNQGSISGGKSTRKCLQNGTWSGREPRCDLGTICPVEGSTHWGTSCYFISTKKLSFSEAHQYCLESGGHLIHVTSQEENAYITSRLESPSTSRYWIGVRRKYEREGSTWYLTDGETPFQFFTETVNEVSAIDNCAVYAYRTQQGIWSWFTLECAESLMHPICEHDIVN